MTAEVINELKKCFIDKNYNDAIKIMQNKIAINKSNYEQIFKQILEVLNVVRKDRYIEEQEDIFEEEKSFITKIINNAYRNLILSNMGENMDEINEFFISFYYMATSITGTVYGIIGDDSSEKVK